MKIPSKIDNQFEIGPCILVPIIALIAALTLSSCGRAVGEVNSISSYSTDIDELGKRIHLPYRPQSVQWQILSPSYIPRNDYALVAVIKFSPEDHAKIKAMLEAKPSVSNMRVSKVYVPDWLPSSVKTVFVETEFKGVFAPSGVNVYAPTLFVKTPLLNGSSFITDDGYVLIHLFTI
jgi:hypothetical protein